MTNVSFCVKNQTR